MIINFKATKVFLVHFLIALSVVGNIYAITTINAMDSSLAGCEDYVKQIEAAKMQYVQLFGEVK